ncbi:MAG: HD domain-containing protein [Nitrososphaerales archaeon]
MSFDKIYEKAYNFSKESLKNEKVSNLDHTLRVLKWCERIGMEEKADLEVLRLAAILHDVAVPKVGRKKHCEESAKMAKNLLAEDLPKDKLEKIIGAISTHSKFVNGEPKTKEAKILYDADLLDCIGAIGIVRAVLRAISDGASGNLDEMLDVLKNVQKTFSSKLHFDSAKKIGEERLKFLEGFIKELEMELKGEK